MYEDIILEIIQHVKDDIEVDKLEINKIRKERNKLKKILYRLKVCERILNNEEN